MAQRRARQAQVASGFVVFYTGCMTTTVSNFALSDAEWLAHRHVEGQDSFRMIHVPRALHSGVPFLTDEYLGGRATQDIPAQAAMALPAGSQPDGPALHFLFHSAFCGSTLLTRALDHAGLSMGLSEPVLINDVVGFRRRGAPPAAVARLADLSLRLLARPFGRGEAVIVKPSNVINPLAHLLLALRPGARVVFLYAPLPIFLTSVVRKGLECRLWARELLAGYIRDGVVDLGFSAEEYFRLTDLQVAAVGWLVQHRLFTALAKTAGPQRIASLDSERLTDDPAASIAAVLRHYGMRADAAIVAAILGGPAFGKHSKSGAVYSADTRRADYAAAHRAHADEIDKVCGWAEQVAAGVGLAMTGHHPLL